MESSHHPPAADSAAPSASGCAESAAMLAQLAALRAELDAACARITALSAEVAALDRGLVDAGVLNAAALRLLDGRLTEAVKAYFVHEAETAEASALAARALARTDTLTEGLRRALAAAGLPELRERLDEADGRAEVLAQRLDAQDEAWKLERALLERQRQEREAARPGVASRPAPRRRAAAAALIVLPGGAA